MLFAVTLFSAGVFISGCGAVNGETPKERTRQVAVREASFEGEYFKITTTEGENLAVHTKNASVLMGNWSVGTGKDQKPIDGTYADVLEKRVDSFTTFWTPKWITLFTGDNKWTAAVEERKKKLYAPRNVIPPDPNSP